MLKKTLALMMLGAAFSAPGWADWGDGPYYGRVIRVEPAISIGFQDARSRFQIQYEFGGARYWTYSDYRPGPWIAVPSPRVVYRYRDDDHGPYGWHEREHNRWEHGRWEHHHRDRWNDGRRGDWRHGDDDND